jgi:hypothetical protein
MGEIFGDCHKTGNDSVIVVKDLVRIMNQGKLWVIFMRYDFLFLSRLVQDRFKKYTPVLYYLYLCSSVSTEKLPANGGIIKL